MISKTACVVVLGDMGRSPRMCNHVLSLAEQDFQVTFIGYGGSALPQRLRLHSGIHPIQMKPVPAILGKICPRLVFLIFKVLWQIVSLFIALPFFIGPDFLLVQNPPSVPTLTVCYVYTVLHRGTKLIVDWHNYGYTILSMSLNPSHSLVKLSKVIESRFGSKAHASFCVSKAMKQDLEKRWGIEAKILYDRPPEEFSSISVKDRHKLFQKLEFSSEEENVTWFTEEFAGNRVDLREDRPGLLVSSTSWTEDEDFGILLQALDNYERFVAENPIDFPAKLVCVITGKGPMKDYYKKVIEDRKFDYVQVITPWLEPEDYPKMLASADLGVCLHTSSSGLDLPMKVVDMFGCGLPVAAIDFPALPELVRNKENGEIFKTSEDLGIILRNWFYGFPKETSKKYSKYSRNLEEFQSLRWSDYWLHTAYPVFNS